MATIPLPALHTAPIEQPASPLRMMGEMMGIKGQQQEQAQRAAMEPLQQQQAQQSIESGQLTLEQQQQAQKDQLAFRSAMQAPENSGKTFSDIADTLAHQGAISMQGWQAMKKADVEQRMQNASYTKTQLDNNKEANAQLLTLYNNAMAMKPDEFASAWPTLVQQVAHIPGVQKMNLDPNQPQTQDQLSHIGPFLAMHNQYLDEELARRQKQVELGQKENESNFYAQNGGAPGVSPEMMQQADWLKKNPGKGPSDYAIAMKKLVPAFNFNLQNQAAAGGAQPGGGPIDPAKTAQRYGMTPAAFDQTAEKYYATGQLPPIGRNANAIAMNRDLMNRAAELHPNGSLAESSAEYKANTASLKTLQANFDQVSAFEGTANKNIEMLKGLAQKVPDLGTRFADVPIRMLSGNVIGSENMAAFKTALAPVQAESAKILNSANLSGQLSDSSRHELQDIVDGNLPYKSLVSSLGVLQQDFKNRHESIRQQIQDIQGRIRGAGPSAPAGSGAAPQEGATKVNSHGDKIVFRGGQWQMAQ